MRIRFALVALAALTVAACGAPPPADDARSDPPQSFAPATDEGLTGAWTLVSMGGAPMAVGQPRIEMIAGPRTLRAHSQCVAFWQRYALDGERVTISPFGPVVMCARGLSEQEARFERALGSVTAGRREDGRLTLTTAEGDLVFDAAPRPADVPIRGDWRVTEIDGKRPVADRPIAVTIDDGRIDATSDCVRAAWVYHQIGGALELTPAPVETCERALSPGEAQLFEAMEMVHTATVLPDGDLILNSGLEQVRLKRWSA